jgi:hypothetical protein
MRPGGEPPPLQYWNEADAPFKRSSLCRLKARVGAGGSGDSIKI